MAHVMMLMLMYLLSQMGKGGSSGSQATIPSLSASRTQLPYGPPSRPGAGGVTYFSPMKYMAGGGMTGLGGLSTLGSYSDGGRLLRGPGDGVSDSIPATIGGKQPARLADGEFVIPADVVSHLGNGSTDAGAKVLYKMMDQVRRARTGNSKQGKQINPKKFIPK